MPSSSFFTVEPHDSGQSADAGEETAVNELPIDGAPIPLGGVHQFKARGRTLRSNIHPLLSEGIAWITEKLVDARTQSSFVVRSPNIPMAFAHALCREQACLFFLKNSSSIHTRSPIKGSLPPDSRLDPYDPVRYTNATLQFIEECGVVFEELQETHAQYTVPGYLNRFSKLYESHFEAFCAVLNTEVQAIFIHRVLIFSC